MKNVLLVCASLLSVALATTAFAFVTPKVDANENTGGRAAFPSDTQPEITCAVCSGGVGGSPSGLQAVVKGQTSVGAIRPPVARVTTPATSGSTDAERPPGK